jgi:hypothetical protein
MTYKEEDMPDMPEGFSMSIGASHNNADVWLKVI